MHKLPAGIMPHDTSIEFFACHNMAAYCVKNGATVMLDQFDAHLIGIVKADMLLNPKKVKGIRAMGITGETETINQYLVCNYGGFDNSPDMVNGVLGQKEYWACPKRGTCKQEGIVCDGLRTERGKFLTPAEIAVLKRVLLGEFNKEIADYFNTAVSTIATHTRNIRDKTGLSRKVDLALFAKEKNLI